MKLKQQTLNLCLKDPSSFNNFFVGRNAHLVDVLSNFFLDKNPHFIYVWGQLGAGKSHILSALSQLFGERGLVVAYLPFEDSAKFEPEILDNLESVDLLCLDDINLIAGEKTWEEKIFHCFNVMLVHGKRLVITGDAPPQALSLHLFDLRSRISGGLIFELHALNDIEKIAALKLRAKLRGLDLSDAVASFLLHHYERSPQNLFEALEKLDQAALAAQRKLTIPFVKEVLDRRE